MWLGLSAQQALKKILNNINRLVNFSQYRYKVLIMNVKELIEILNKVEDKSIPVCIADWSECYMPDGVADQVTEENGEYLVVGKERKTGRHVLITIK